MSTTRYVTGNGTGVVTVIARALDPNGNQITQTIPVTINPAPEIPKCYNAIIALSPGQFTVEAACAQFGVANTYYLGNPRNTLYVNDSCSDIATDGYYKTEEGNWVNVNGGAIRERGSCANIAARSVLQDRGLGGARAATPPGSGPQRFETGGVTNAAPPISVRLAQQVQEIFIPQPTFTAPAPTTTPPDPAFIAERAAAISSASQRLAIKQNTPNRSARQAQRSAPVTSLSERIVDNSPSEAEQQSIISSTSETL